jgi:integrase
MVSGLSYKVVAAYIKQRRDDKKANATINRDVEGLKSALKLAFKTNRIFRVPVLPDHLDEKDNVRQGYFSAEEVERLCASAPPWLVEMIRFAFATGWRRGELFSLRWEWVDPAGEIRLPKTKNGEGRVIPIAGELVPIMERLQKARAVERPDGSAVLSEWVFHDGAQPITKKRFILAWNAARKAAKLEGKLFHDFRRSAARRHIAAGVSQAVAMRITGHKTPSMFRRYQIVESSDVALALQSVASAKREAKSNVRKFRRR